MDLSTVCKCCGLPAARIEILAPGQLPQSYGQWTANLRQQYDTYQDRTAWRMIYGGIEAGNGVGDVITPERAQTLIAILSQPLDTSRLDHLELYDDAGICRTCGVAYCYRHWSPTDTGYGSCPEGHGKSLDPHWSPAWDE